MAYCGFDSHLAHYLYVGGFNMLKRYVKGFSVTDYLLQEKNTAAEHLGNDINTYMRFNEAKLIDVTYSTVYDTVNNVAIHSALCIFELEEGESL